MSLATGSASVPVRREALTHLAAVRTQLGYVPDRVIGEVADTLQVSKSHLRRMLREFQRTNTIRRRPPSSRRMGLPDEHRAKVMYFVHKGNAAAAWAGLRQAGDIPAEMSLKTFQRRVEEWDPALRSCAKGGYRAMVQHQFFNVEHIPYRGYAYGSDHTKLPIMVLPTRGSTPIWPWLTTLLDLKHRILLAYKLTAHVPTSADNIDTLLEGVDGWYTDDGVFVGGKPDFLRTDRGGDYISQALTMNLLNLDIGRQFTQPYSSHQNGRVEAFNGTIDQAFAPTVPGFHPGGEDEYTRRVLKTPVLPTSLMTLDTLDRRLGDFFGDYNNTPHSALNGMTPLQSWAADEHVMARADKATIVAAMTPRETRRLHHYGIEIRNAFYSHPTLATLRKANVTQVEVRFHEHDRAHVEVFVNGEHQCTATKTTLQSDHHRMGVLSARGAQRREAERLVRSADYERVLAERARQRAEGIDDADLPVLPPHPDEDDNASDTLATAAASGALLRDNGWSDTAGAVLSGSRTDALTRMLAAHDLDHDELDAHTDNPAAAATDQTLSPAHDTNTEGAA